MKFFLSLCLLFSLVSPAMLLTCNMCENATGIECSSKNKETCGRGDYICKSIAINGSGPIDVSLAKYSCILKGQCDTGHYAFTTDLGGFFDMVVRCCKANMCNSKDLELPLMQMKPNELECIGCYARGEKCKGGVAVRCRGDQTKCIKMNIAYSKGMAKSPIKVSLRGCATPDMCQEKKVMRHRYNNGLILNKMTVKCTDAL